MAEDKIDFRLDLDSDAFASKLTGAIDGVRNLQAGLTKVAVVAGVVAAAYLAIKTSLSLAFRAEEIKSLHTQFDILSKQAGVAGDTILRGMLKASDGLMDAEDAIKLANKAFIQLGENSNRIPEIMDAARKSSIIFGTSIEDAFTRITQAIATGQTTQLKQLGVIIDTDKAYRDYAASLGIATNALSQQGKTNAITNIAIDQLNSKLAGVDTTVKKTTDSWTRFKVALGELKDAVAVTMGPSAVGMWTQVLNGWTLAFDRLSEVIVDNLGNGSDAAAAQVLGLNRTLGHLKAQLGELEKTKPEEGSILGFFTSEGRVRRIDLIKQKIQETEAALRSANQAVTAKGNGEVFGPPPPGTAAPDSSVDQKRLQENANQFRKDLLALNQEKLLAEMATAQSIAQVNQQAADQAVNLAEQTAIRIQDITNSGSLDGVQKAQEILLIEQNAAAQSAMIAENLEAQKIAALDRYALHAGSVFERVAATQQANALRGAKGQNQAVNLMNRGVDSFKANYETAFMDLGAGTKDAGEVIKSIFFNMLGDMAQQQGSFFLAQFVGSMFTNVGALAGATAMFTLAGFLKGQGGGGAASAAPGGSAMTGGSPTLGEDGSRPELAEDRQKRAVSLVIQGNYYETEQTKTRLIEIIREAQDATDISISTIGGR